MKLILAFVVVIVMVACQKENTIIVNSTNLIGEWNWISSTGGIGGFKYTPSSTSVQRKITFASDSVFRLYQNDSLKTESKYHVSMMLASNGLDTIKVVKYDGSSIRQYFEIQSDGTMVLSDECMDCYIHEYKRIR